MYNVDKYFDFDLPQKEEVKKRKKKRQQQGLLLLLLLTGATCYYYMVYLPEEERKRLEEEIQNKLDEVKSLKSEEYDNIPTLLTVCQSYLLWKNGTEPRKLALQNKKQELESAIKWLKENQETPERLEEKKYKKGRIWELPTKSWADKKLKKIAGELRSEYQEEANIFSNGDKNPNFRFSRTAAYEIFFLLLYKSIIKKEKTMEKLIAQCLKEKKIWFCQKILSFDIKTQSKIQCEEKQIEEKTMLFFMGWLELVNLPP